MKDIGLPVVYCFPASSPLSMEDYSIHTFHVHTPPWLPPSIVPMIIDRYSNTRNIWPIAVDHGTIDTRYDILP